MRTKAELWTKKYTPEPSFPCALGIDLYPRMPSISATCSGHGHRLLFGITRSPSHWFPERNVGIAIKEEKHPDLVEPFNEHELEILRLLVTDLLPAEVAKKLFLIG